MRKNSKKYLSEFSRNWRKLWIISNENCRKNWDKFFFEGKGRGGGRMWEGFWENLEKFRENQRNRLEKEAKFWRNTFFSSSDGNNSETYGEILKKSLEKCSLVVSNFKENFRNILTTFHKSLGNCK